MAELVSGIELPADCAFRPIGPGDAAEVAALLGAVGESRSAEHVRGDWGRPTFSLADDAIGVVDASGRLVGFEEVEDQGGHAQLGCWGGVVSPDRTGEGIGRALLGWAVRRAAGHAPLADPARRVVLTSGLLADAPGGAARLDAAGFVPVRTFRWMARDLDGPVEPAAWPEGVVVASMAPGEEEAFWRVQRETFASHWGMAPIGDDEDLRRFRERIAARDDFDPALFLGARCDGELLGICLAWPTHEGDPSCAWVTVLGVRAPWRGRGLGRALLLETFAALRGRGIPRVELSVDTANDTGAPALYARTGMRTVRTLVVRHRVIREVIA